MKRKFTNNLTVLYVHDDDDDDDGGGLACEEITNLLWDPKVHSCPHKNPHYSYSVPEESEPHPFTLLSFINGSTALCWALASSSVS
jgi:hypothetical protein